MKTESATNCTTTTCQFAAAIRAPRFSAMLRRRDARHRRKDRVTISPGFRGLGLCARRCGAPRMCSVPTHDLSSRRSAAVCSVSLPAPLGLIGLVALAAVPWSRATLGWTPEDTRARVLDDIRTRVADPGRRARHGGRRRGPRRRRRRGGAAGSTDAVRTLFDRVAALQTAIAPLAALTIYDADGVPLAWEGRPASLPASRALRAGRDVSRADAAWPAPGAPRADGRRRQRPPPRRRRRGRGGAVLGASGRVNRPRRSRSTRRSPR